MREIKGDGDVEALWAAGVRPALIGLAARKLADLVSAYEAEGAVYDPDADGFIVLLESGDDIEGMPEVGLSARYRGLVGVPKDYVGRHDEAAAWEIVVCFSNSEANTFIVGDELPLPQALIDELQGAMITEPSPGRIGALIAAGWNQYAVSSLWPGTAVDFMHVAYLAPQPDGVPDALLVARDGDSSVIRAVFEPLFMTVAGLVDVAVGSRLTYTAEVDWTEACEFLLLDVEAADPSGGGRHDPTNLVVLRVVCDPRDLCFSSERDLEAFIRQSVDRAVQRLEQAKGGQDA